MRINISKQKIFFAVLAFILFNISVKAQISDLYINEFTASNTSGLQDNFSEYSDWIELYNGGSTEINLDGYTLTDDKNSIEKWKFSNFTLQPGNYLTIFASGKDIKATNIVWATIIDAGDKWKAEIPRVNIPGWNSPDFNDSGWASAKSGFGYADDDDETIVGNKIVCVYVRKEFTIDNPENVIKALLHIDYDDAFIAYINGVEIARDNIGTAGTPVNFNTYSDSDHEAKMYGGGKPDAFEIDDISSYLIAGTNVIAIEVHNASANSSDMSLIPFLSLGFSSVNETPYANEILGLPGSAMHTNFKLSSGGEFIGLYDTQGNVVDTITFSEQIQDISFGRSSANTALWGFMGLSTPDTENSAEFLELSLKPQFSIQGGFYTGAQNLTLSTNSATAKIYYTSNGTPPDTNSKLYSTPITLDSTIAIRAFSTDEGRVSSEIITQTFFIDEQINMPFISLVTDPDHLFSDETGIYVTGTNGRQGDCDPTIRNVNQDWEQPVNIEFYEPNGELGFNQVAGIKIFGGCSRTRFPQKSFALYARSSYGKGSFKHQIFTDKPINDFEAFLLRSAADDQQRTFMRDGLSQEVVLEYMDLDYQAFRPAVVFINGEYWGIHNIREKINEHYFDGNFGVDKDELNILDKNGYVVYGDNTSYNTMINFVRQNNLSNANNFANIEAQINIAHFIEYEIANIYLGEVDWPGNNIKFWNTNSGENSKWRWVNFDRDQCFQYWRIDANTLDLATFPDNYNWPNPEWSTLLLRKLLDNEGFKNQFIQMYAYHLSTTFNPERLIHHIDSFQSILAPEIPRHTKRWGDQLDTDSQETWQSPTFKSLVEWNNFVDTMRLFSIERPPYAIQHIIDKFDLDTTDNLAINKNLVNAGVINLYNRKIPNGEYNGDYFSGVPIKLDVTPAFGYKFSHWIASTENGDQTFETKEIEIILDGDMQLTAYFETTNFSADLVVIINEINYHSSDSFDANDWMEIYNRNNEPIEMSGWYLKDSDDDNIFYFPDGFELNGNSYFVICQDTAAFDILYPDVTNRTGDLDFKLSNGGEVLRLYSHDNILIDSVLYDDVSPWPTLADGNGPTLELLGTDLDNNLAENWVSNEQYFGTPGRINGLADDIYAVISINNLNTLYQNYPNPFNNSTIIPYSISESGNVRIVIYDILGNQIISLVNQHREAGKYITELNAGNLSNGIFIYTMHVNGQPVKTKRMVVNK